MTTTTTTQSKAQEIDTAIVDTFGKLNNALHLLSFEERDVIRYARSNGVVECEYRNYDYYFTMTGTMTPATVELVREFLPVDRLTGYDAAAALVTKLSADYKSLNEQYTGWSRFFLVAGGHVHSSMGCSSCNKGRDLTQFGWLPALSGLTEAEAVAQHGAILCTVCFPSAPVEWTNAYELKAQAAKAARCSGSGQYVNSARRYAKCPVCETSQALTSNYKVRAHKAS